MGSFRNALQRPEAPRCRDRIRRNAEYNNDLKELSIRRGGNPISQACTTGKIDKLLISGDNGDLIDKGLKEAAKMKAVLVKWVIPAKDIINEQFPATRTKMQWKRKSAHALLSEIRFFHAHHFGKAHTLRNGLLRGGRLDMYALPDRPVYRT